MKEKPSSKTAYSVCLMRACESEISKETRGCFDPFAKYYISSRFNFFRKKIMLKSFFPWLLKKFANFTEIVVVRMNFIEDCLKESINEGFKQLVILGAGYDSRAYRFKYLLENIKIFEVDDHSTQELKKKG